jgi:hypothetical protein
MSKYDAELRRRRQSEPIGQTRLWFCLVVSADRLDHDDLTLQRDNATLMV